MTAKEGGLPGGDSELFKELEMQVRSPLKFCHFLNLFNVTLNWIIHRMLGGYL